MNKENLFLKQYEHYLTAGFDELFEDFFMDSALRSFLKAHVNPDNTDLQESGLCILKHIQMLATLKAEEDTAPINVNLFLSGH